MNDDVFNDIINQIKDYYTDLKKNGVSQIMNQEEARKYPESLSDSNIVESKDAVSEFPSESVSHESPTPEIDAERYSRVKKELLDFENAIKNCDKCSVLVKNRTQVVFGAGNPCAKLMFVGEAPGKDEDIQGIPFVGKAGKLLTLILNSIGLSRDDVYIGNILKCRPPENRNPLPDEIDNCKNYLYRQIEIIKPKVICTLGSFATKTLLNTTKNISSLRGQQLSYKDSILIPTFHPSYLLRSPYAKKEVWKDMLKVKNVLSE